MSIPIGFAWFVRERMGRYFSTLLLDSYAIPSFEEISKAFETHAGKGKISKVKLTFIMDLFVRMNQRLHVLLRTFQPCLPFGLFSSQLFFTEEIFIIVLRIIF